MILITGASGYIGKQLADSFSKKGQDLRLLVRSKNGFKRHKNIEIVKGDITDLDSLKDTGKDVDTVIHLAGVISYRMRKDEIFRTNVEGTRNVLKACRKAERFIFSSSVAVYAPQSDVKPISEKYSTRPTDPYGMSKLAAEKEIEGSGIPHTILRIAPVYGIGAPYMTKIMDMLRKGYPVPDVRTLTHMVSNRNVLQALELSLKRGRNGIYNVADGSPMKFLDFAEAVTKNLGVEMKIWHAWLEGVLAFFTGFSGQLNAMIKPRNYDIGKAKKDLGYKPKENFMGEIARMVEAYRKGK